MAEPIVPTTVPVPTVPATVPPSVPAQDAESRERQKAATAQPTTAANGSASRTRAANELSRLGLVEAAAVLESLEDILASRSGRSRHEASGHLSRLFSCHDVPRWIFSEVRVALEQFNQQSIDSWFAELEIAVNAARKAFEAASRNKDRNLQRSLENQARARIRDGREALDHLSAKGWVERTLWANKGLDRRIQLQRDLEQVEIRLNGLADR